jgi:hypothetical protein
MTPLVHFLGILARTPRTDCGAAPATPAASTRARVDVLVIILSSVILLVLTGHDAASAVGIVAAAGIAAVEIATRLLAGRDPATG